MRLAMLTSNPCRPHIRDKRHACTVSASILIPVLLLGGCGVSPPDLERNRASNRARDRQALQRAIRQLPERVDLRACIRVALEQNLDAAVIRQEESIRLEAATGAKRRMLPSLMASGELSRRTKRDASTSRTLLAGRRTHDPSYSEERGKSTRSLALAWNLLDFGIAYFRSRQARDKASIAAMRLRRARQNLALQVTEAYWDAQAARLSMQRARKLTRMIETQRALVRKQVKENIKSRLKGLKIETGLMDTQARLARYRRDYLAGLARLGALMGLPAGGNLKLADEPFAKTPPPPAMDFVSLENEALLQRPELYEQDLQGHIAADEARIALASMFPNASLFGRREHDGDDFLYNHNWYTVGLSASLDLLSIPAKRSRRRLAFLRAALARKRRLALAAAVITQVHLAAIDYEDARREYRFSRELRDKRRELVVELRKERRITESADDKQGSEREGITQELMNAQAQLFFAHIRVLKTFARLQTNYQRLRNSLGRPCSPTPATPPDASRHSSTPAADGERGGPQATPAPRPPGPAPTATVPPLQADDFPDRTRQDAP